MSQDWTEKYRPDGLSKIIGNPKAVSVLRNWADSWNRGVPDKRAAVLIGSPGIGKTSAAVALANDMKWDIVEMNASDQRNGDAIKSIAQKGADFDTFSCNGEFLSVKEGGRKLIILDEADNLFGREDRGAVPAISELIRNAKQPVILIMNDFYEMSRKSAAIKTQTLQITFMRPRTDTIVSVLDRIAKAEKVAVPREVLVKIAENSNNDMRAAVRNLEALSLGRNAVTADDVCGLSDRIIRKDIYDLMKAVFREKDALKVRRMMMDVDETPDHIMLWIDENMPSEYKDKGDLMRGYEKLTRADVFLGRVSRRQYYGLWSYAGDMMSMGVNISRRSESRSFERFRFPSYLTKMSRSKNARNLKKSVCLKLSAVLHTSTGRMAQDVLPMLKVMLKNDKELTVCVVKDAGLEPEEVAFIIDAKVDSKAVKEAMGPSAAGGTQADNASGDVRTVKKKEHGLKEERPGPKKEHEQKKEPPKAQKSLFQF